MCPRVGVCTRGCVHVWSFCFSWARGLVGGRSSLAEAVDRAGVMGRWVCCINPVTHACGRLRQRGDAHIHIRSASAGTTIHFKKRERESSTGLSLSPISLSICIPPLTCFTSPHLTFSYSPHLLLPLSLCVSLSPTLHPLFYLSLSLSRSLLSALHNPSWPKGERGEGRRG